MSERLEAGAVMPVDRVILEAAEQADIRPLQRWRVKMNVRFRGPMYDDLVDAVHAELRAYGMIDERGQVQAAIDWATILEVIIPLLLELFGGFFSRR